jgi:dTDP-glucose 4,6-dehydratase
MAEHPLTGRRVFITGATGFLGTHLTRELVGVGAKVHALRRNAISSTRLPCSDVIWHLGDLNCPESLTRTLHGIVPDVVFHLAAYGTTYDQQNISEAYQVNIAGTWNLWRALESIDCRLIYTGTCAEYGQVKSRVTEEHACRTTWFSFRFKPADSA